MTWTNQLQKNLDQVTADLTINQLTVRDYVTRAVMFGGVKVRPRS